MSSRRSSPRSWASPRTKSPHLIVVVVVAVALAHPPTNRYLSLLFPPRCCVAFSSLLLSISFSLSLSPTAWRWRRCCLCRASLSQLVQLLHAAAHSNAGSVLCLSLCLEGTPTIHTKSKPHEAAVVRYRTTSLSLSRFDASSVRVRACECSKQMEE